MRNITQHIPYYQEINDFLAAIPSEYRTGDPLFYCLRLKENEGSINNYMPPFKKGFYFIGLVTNAGETKITYDNVDVTKLDSFLVFQSLGHLYSFYRDKSASGYLIYFKKENFSFFRPDLEKEFPFFDLMQTNFFKINQSKYKSFSPAFEDVFAAYEQAGAGHNGRRIATLKLLTLLYQLKDFTLAFKQWEEGFNTPQQLLLQKYIQLINNFYLEKRTVEEYAELLNITPHHLSQSIKAASQRNALSYINDRIMAEAKTLIRHTDMNMAEIAYQLDFSDPANFGKFFKKHAGLTPLAFRNA